jgi:macrolide transport system ATP-binding/permease protein
VLEQGVTAVYFPAAQVANGNFLAVIHAWFQPSWIVRTENSMDSVGSEMQHTMASVDPNLPFSGVYNMNDLMAETLAIQRLEVALLVTMASLALLLNAVGIFALVANIVLQKKRGIGIRMAMDSTIGRAMYQIARYRVIASLVGVAIGLILAAVALPAVRGALFGQRRSARRAFTAAIVRARLPASLAALTLAGVQRCL